jgi:5-methyltetrahydrofolate--homocysteine methyltransferase
MLIIGERIDATRRYVAQAIASQNRGFIQSEARDQAVSGADYINVNAAIFGEGEAGHLRWVVDAVQEVTDLPLCIDSPDPTAIRAVLPLVAGIPMINAITLEMGRMEGILALAIDYRAKVIASCQAGNGPAETTAAKVEIAGRLIDKITAAGIPLEDIYVDPLAYSLSTNSLAARATLDAIGQIMERFPGVHTTCCPGTVSYGLPARSLIHRTFLAAAVDRGLDSAIIDPTDRELVATLKAGELIAGRDESCLGYIAAFRKGSLA